jgi:hypothetical protein
MRIFVTILALLSFACPSLGETTWTSVKKFIPKGYDTLDGGYVKGDLNKDGKEDFVLALRSLEEEKNSFYEGERLMIVLLQTPNGLKQVGNAKDVLMCKGCGGIFGDPWSGIQIEKGILIVDHYGGSAWRWSDTQKFRYQNEGMYLIGSTSDYFWVNSDCNGEGIGDAGRNYKDVNWVTGDEEVIKRKEDCTLIEHTKKKLKRRPLQKLEEYKQVDE